MVRIRSASICYGFVRLYEKSKEKSMVRLVARRGGVHLNRFTSKLKSSYVSLSSKPPFFRQTLSCWLADLMLSKSGSNTPRFPFPRTINPNCLTLCSFRSLIFFGGVSTSTENIKNGSSHFSMGLKRGSSLAIRMAFLITSSASFLYFGVMVPTQPRSES